MPGSRTHPVRLDLAVLTLANVGQQTWTPRLLGMGRTLQNCAEPKTREVYVCFLVASPTSSHAGPSEAVLFFKGLDLFYSYTKHT